MPITASKINKILDFCQFLIKTLFSAKLCTLKALGGSLEDLFNKGFQFVAFLYNWKLFRPAFRLSTFDTVLIRPLTIIYLILCFSPCYDPKYD